MNLGRRCLQDFYLPRYFILENVRNFVSPAADDDGGFMMSEDSNTNTKPKIGGSSPPTSRGGRGTRES